MQMSGNIKDADYRCIINGINKSQANKLKAKWNQKTRPKKWNIKQFFLSYMKKDK